MSFLSEKNQEILDKLTDDGLLPSKKHFSPDRFFKGYAEASTFWGGVALIVFSPIYSVAIACYHAAKAVWALLTAVGNILILKPGDASNALLDTDFHLTMSLCIAVMAPVHALTHLVEVITRTISSWFAGTENELDLSQKSFSAQWSLHVKPYTQSSDLPSAQYLTAKKFFSPYNGPIECMTQMAAPIERLITAGVNFLKEAFIGTVLAVECLTNLLICKHQHALDNLKNMSLHFGLAFSLALMTPVNAVVEGLAFVTRLGTTWHSACTTQPNVPHHNEQLAASL